MHASNIKNIQQLYNKSCTYFIKDTEITNKQANQSQKNRKDSAVQ